MIILEENNINFTKSCTNNKINHVHLVSEQVSMLKNKHVYSVSEPPKNCSLLGEVFSSLVT